VTIVAIWLSISLIWVISARRVRIRPAKPASGRWWRNAPKRTANELTDQVWAALAAQTVTVVAEARRRARIRSKGGNVDMVVWAAPTARLLGRYLTNRTTGPVFLTRWRTRIAPARRDLYEPTGQARLRYRTAAAGFKRYSGGWTLHQLRHSSLTHLAEAGVSASNTPDASTASTTASARRRRKRPRRSCAPTSGWL